MIATHHEVVIAGLRSMLLRLWRYGLVLERNPETAEDLVQTTCVRALEKSSQIDIGTRLDRWLFAILRTIWINQLRGHRVRSDRGVVDAEALISDWVRKIETNIVAAQVLREVF